MVTEHLVSMVHISGIFYQVNSDVKKIVKCLRKVFKPCYLNDVTIYEMI